MGFETAIRESLATNALNTALHAIVIINKCTTIFVAHARSTMCRHIIRPKEIKQLSFMTLHKTQHRHVINALRNALRNRSQSLWNMQQNQCSK